MKLTGSYIFATLAIISCVASIALYDSHENFSEIIGCVSTIVSIALSIISMYTSYVTENKTEKTLDEIKDNNKTLVNMIHCQLSQDNYDEENIKDLSHN